MGGRPFVNCLIRGHFISGLSERGRARFAALGGLIDSDDGVVIFGVGADPGIRALLVARRSTRHHEGEQKEASGGPSGRETGREGGR